MPTSLVALLELLDLEVLEENLFRGLSPETPHQRVFGGQVAAQALVAAGRTVEADRRVHSLHSYFLRPGDPAIPIVFEVDRIRDGRSFATRRVVAIQHGRAIFNLSASFQIDEPGPDHAMAMPDVPDPESVPTVRERVETKFGDAKPDEALEWLGRGTPLEVRHLQEPHWMEPTRREPSQDLWFRAAGPMPDDPLLHACVVAYASDLSLIDTATLPHAIGYDTGFMIASLDHAMWFHREFRADQWLLYHQVSPSASGARGLAEGYVFRRDGALVVTVIQEGLIRPLR
ncbi:MAG: acyl-CoA thioesterase [Actinomycetota bacterium]